MTPDLLLPFREWIGSWVESGMFWFWGLAGAFIYAGPKLNACMRQAKLTDPPGRCTMCVWDFVVAVVSGAIAAGAFTEAATAFLHRVAPGELRGIATLIGLGANEWAPKVVKALSGKIGQFGKEQKP